MPAPFGPISAVIVPRRDIERRPVDREHAREPLVTTERTSSSGVSPAGTKDQLLSLAEDPLRPEDHERHQDGPTIMKRSAATRASESGSSR